MEQVLCISRNRLPETWVSRRTVAPMAFEDFISGCTSGGFVFLDRPLAEQDPGYKQIIPYILLQTHDRKLTAAYCRKGSEERLHDLWSIGIGGHINPLDQSRNGEDLKEIVMSGMERELDEELTRRPATDKISFLGVISEDMTPVGSVHLGAVFRLVTRTPERYTPGPELNRFQWMKTGDLGSLSLELWSELALELADSSSCVQDFENH